MLTDIDSKRLDDVLLVIIQYDMADIVRPAMGDAVASQFESLSWPNKKKIAQALADRLVELSLIPQWKRGQ